mmetsp:Transcript_172632/g.548214  ORF Transcript_172632/g.548214 Transcript_172632/m.548214 type:complete len:81 (-) Transcript_172632:4045-4287(-)
MIHQELVLMSAHCELDQTSSWKSNARPLSPEPPAGGLPRSRILSQRGATTCRSLEKMQPERARLPVLWQRQHSSVAHQVA